MYYVISHQVPRISQGILGITLIDKHARSLRTIESVETNHVSATVPSPSPSPSPTQFPSRRLDNHFYVSSLLDDQFMSDGVNNL